MVLRMIDATSACGKDIKTEDGREEEKLMMGDPRNVGGRGGERRFRIPRDLLR